MSSSISILTNNPFNIRYDKRNHWLGCTGSHKGFVCFENIDYGVRAALLLLTRYIVVYRLKTIKAIITKYAPPSENDTDNYISYVRRSFEYHKIDPPYRIEVDSKAFYVLARAMAIFESRSEFHIEYLKYIFDRFNIKSHFGL